MEFISITKDPKIAKYFEDSGIDDVMVDLEIIGKQERQKGLNTVISAHTMEDVSNVRSVLTKSKLLVRINPVYENTKNEVDEAIDRGADIIMLPMFKKPEEVSLFLEYVGDRAQKYLLLETAAAMTRIDDVLELSGIDAIHIGLNDLSISMDLDFLYEPLIGGLIDYMAEKIKAKNIKYGFGGVSRLERGKLILSEHYRLGSEMVIINRDFRFYKENYDEIIEAVDMKKELLKITNYLNSLSLADRTLLEYNRILLKKEIREQMNK
ncbi:MAG: aldolase [Firmicutes bacterium]|nr:aldolase [Bacillota bacterium]